MVGIPSGYTLEDRNFGCRQSDFVAGDPFWSVLTLVRGMATSVSAVYLHVVDSVVSKLREEFLNEGVDDGVLSELQAVIFVPVAKGNVCFFLSCLSFGLFFAASILVLELWQWK